MALQGGAKAMQLDCRARMEGPLDRPLAGRAGRGVSPRPRNPQLKIRLIGCGSAWKVDPLWGVIGVQN